MKNQYYLKDKKAMIYWEKKLDEPNKNGYVPFAEQSLWCYSKQLSQDRIFTAAFYFDVEETRFFVFNNIPGIYVYDYIFYRNDWYQITRVDTMEDYKGDMFVYVKDCPMGKKPKQRELLPYEPCDRQNS